MPVSVSSDENAGMADETEQGHHGSVPANDNRSPGGAPDCTAAKRVNRAALTLARLIGRRMAREQFAALAAANDNRPETPKPEASDGETSSE
jgi:hypothetical protein